MGVDTIAAEFRDDGVDTQKLTKFIEEYFGYAIPWGVSGLIKIACNVLKLEREDLSKHSAFFGSMVKYGIPTPEGAWAMLVGIPFRELAIRVSDESMKRNIQSRLSKANRLVWLNDSVTIRITHFRQASNLFCGLGVATVLSFKSPKQAILLSS